MQGVLMTLLLFVHCSACRRSLKLGWLTTRKYLRHMTGQKIRLISLIKHDFACQAVRDCVRMTLVK
jgi:hypothetical protein